MSELLIRLGRAWRRRKPIEELLTYGLHDDLSLTPNGCAERRARRCMSLALYSPRVRSSDLLGNSSRHGALVFGGFSNIDVAHFQLVFRLLKLFDELRSRFVG